MYMELNTSTMPQIINPKNLTSSMHKRNRRGFSLIEMLIVLGIIALIAGFVVGNLGGIFGGAQVDTAKTFVESSLEAPLMQYKLHTGSYPSTAEGISALLSAPTSKATKWRGPYIKQIPEDPWGNPYQYRFPGTKNTGSYDLYSWGPDGTESADDIGNWK